MPRDNKRPLIGQPVEPIIGPSYSIRSAPAPVIEPEPEVIAPPEPEKPKEPEKEKAPKRVSVRIREDLADHSKVLAAQRKTSMAELFETAYLEWLGKEGIKY